jgi:hypothetical protein
LAQINHNGQIHHIGYFEMEEDAAKAANLKCQELNIQLKNPDVGVLDNEKVKKLIIKVSNFWFNFFLIGFCFGKKRAIWENNMFLNRFYMTHFFVFKFFIIFHKTWLFRQIHSILEKKTCNNFDFYFVFKVWQTENNVGMDIICIKSFSYFSF